MAARTEKCDQEIEFACDLFRKVIRAQAAIASRRSGNQGEVEDVYVYHVVDVLCPELNRIARKQREGGEFPLLGWIEYNQDGVEPSGELYEMWKASRDAKAST